MTWLLNQLQKVLGAFSDKRSDSRTVASQVGERDRLPSATVNSDPSDITVAARSPYIPPTEPTSESLSSLADTASINAASSNQSTNIELSNKPNVVEIRNQVDVASASASIPEITDEQPSFPTGVSELLSSSPLDVEPTPEVPTHPIRKLPNEQLPAIQDLLPAVAAPESVIAESEQRLAVKSEPNSNQEHNNEEQARESSLLPNSDQPVLFSFDIVENYNSESSNISVEEAIEQETDDPYPAQSSSSEREDPTYDASQSLAESKELTDEQPLAQPLLDKVALQEEPVETTQLQEQPEERPVSIEVDSVEPLPYPWSTATPIPPQQTVDGAEDDTTVQVLAVAASESSDDVPSAEAASPSGAADRTSNTDSNETDEITEHTAPSIVQSPVKNGTIKLLFTLKEGNFHGYIAPDDGSKDILFHQKYINADIFPKLERGAQVTATVKYIAGKAYATHVDLL